MAFYLKSLIKLVLCVLVLAGSAWLFIGIAVVLDASGKLWPFVAAFPVGLALGFAIYWISAQVFRLIKKLFN